MSRPTVTELLPAASAIYAKNGVGCCLHIVLDDYNVDDASVRFCVGWAADRGHADCEDLARKMLLMKRTARLKLARSAGKGVWR